MDLKAVGNRIRERRVFLKLKQVEVAEMIGMSRSIYARYELGHVDLNMSTVEALARALKVSTNYLIPDEEWMEQEGIVAQYFNGLPPDRQSMILAMIKAAHDEIKRAETTHGKKAE